MKIYLLNEKLQRYKPISIYKSLTWNTFYNKEEGNFTLEVPLSLFPYLVYSDKRDVFIENDSDKNIGVVENLEKKVDDKGTKTLVVKGRLSLSLLDRRVMYDDESYEDKMPSYILNDIMRSNYTAPTDPARQIGLIEYIESDQPRLSITDYKLKRGVDGLVAVKELAKISNFGFYMGLNATEDKLKLQIYKGVDRTTSQNVNERFIVTQTRGSATAIGYYLDRTKEKTYAEIDKENKVRTVYPKRRSIYNSGLKRKETFFDLSSISATITKANGSQVVIKPTYYENMIQNEARTRMSKLVRAEYLDSDLKNEIAKRFKTSLYLGDKVTIIDNETGFSMDAYVLSATEVWSDNGYEVSLDIGNLESEEEENGN